MVHIVVYTIFQTGSFYVVTLVGMHGKPDMRVVLAGVELRSPVIAASGTFGGWREY